MLTVSHIQVASARAWLGAPGSLPMASVHWLHHPVLPGADLMSCFPYPGVGPLLQWPH